jgi:hypothetical protein
MKATFNPETEKLIMRTVTILRLSMEQEIYVRELMSIAYSEGRVSVRQEIVAEHAKGTRHGKRPA